MFDVPFGAVDLHIFDVHTIVSPLVFNNSLKPDFRFLVEANAYNAQYASGKSLLTNSFDIHPLSKHAQNANHVWKNYLRLFPDTAIDYWKLQAPFVCSLRRPTLTLNHSTFQGRVTPTVHLSALGWSSSLNIHLRQRVMIPDLLDFILGTIGGPDGAKPSGLKLNGQPAKVSAVFKYIAERLLAEVYDPANPPSIRPPAMPHHMIVSLTKFVGPPVPYRGDRVPGMTTLDLALLHSLVRGEKIMARDLGKRLAEKPSTLVLFEPNKDFMLIHFDSGALVFMQSSARQSDLRQRRLSCVAANVRSYASLIWSMYSFCQATQNASNAAVLDLRKAVRLNLMAMKDSYSSIPENVRSSVKYAQAVFQNHSGLKSLLKNQ